MRSQPAERTQQGTGSEPRSQCSTTLHHCKKEEQTPKSVPLTSLRITFLLRVDSLSDLRLFFLAVIDSWPLSPSSEFDASESELELDEELLELSDATPDGSPKFTLQENVSKLK